MVQGKRGEKKAGVQGLRDEEEKLKLEFSRDGYIYSAREYIEVIVEKDYRVDYPG